MRNRLATPFLMWAIVAMGGAGALSFLPGRPLWRYPALWCLVMAASVHWVWFLGGGVTANRSAARSAAGVSRIVTTGVYAKVRHPIYWADMVLAWSIAVCLPTAGVFVCVVWLPLVLTAWSRLEEAALLSRFGGTYAACRKHTPWMSPDYSRKG